MKTPDQILPEQIACSPESKVLEVHEEAKNSQKEIKKRKKAINEARKSLHEEEKNLENICRKLWEATKEETGNIAIFYGIGGGEDPLTEEDINRLQEKGQIVFNVSEFLASEAYKVAKDEARLEAIRKKFSETLEYDKDNYSSGHVLNHSYVAVALNEIMELLENSPKGIIRFKDFQHAQEDSSKYGDMEKYFLKSMPDALAKLGYVVEAECDYLPAKDYSGGLPLRGGGSSWRSSLTHLRNPIVGDKIKRGSEPSGVVYTEYGNFYVQEPFEKVIKNR